MAEKKAAKKSPAREVPPVPRKRTQTVVITAEQFMAGINRLTAGLDTLDRLEGILSAVHRNDVPTPEAGEAIGNRIREVPTGKASSDTAPVSVMIDDVHSVTSRHRARLEALRDSLVHGIPPDQPRANEASVQANAASQGPSKDALNWSFSNLAASEALVEEIERYLLNR